MFEAMINFANGGNLEYHDEKADAIVEITGPEGVRRLPIQEFYLSAGKVDLHPGELQTALLIPEKAYKGYFGHYIKYAMREAMDIANLGCSVSLKLSKDKKTVKDARIAYGVAGPVPMRAPSAEKAAKGKPLSKETMEQFAEAVLEDIHPRDSWRASKAFREHIAVEIAESFRCTLHLFHYIKKIFDKCVFLVCKFFGWL
jgi:xanthine dehydrogenase FAD-binding subunit